MWWLVRPIHAITTNDLLKQVVLILEHFAPSPYPSSLSAYPSAHRSAPLPSKPPARLYGALRWLMQMATLKKHIHTSRTHLGWCRQLERQASYLIARRQRAKSYRTSAAHDIARHHATPMHRPTSRHANASHDITPRIIKPQPRSRHCSFAASHHPTAASAWAWAWAARKSTSTIRETPALGIVTPCRTCRRLMVILLWVMTMNCVTSHISVSRLQ